MKANKDIWSKGTPPSKNVDAFIKASPKRSQAKLKEMRRIVRSALPESQEVISYKMPVYKVRGRMLIAFAGFKNHIGFYGMSGTFLDAFKKELKGYETSKGTVRFPLDKPLPAGLIKKLVKARARQLVS